MKSPAAVTSLVCKFCSWEWGVEGWTCTDGTFGESFWEKPLEFYNAMYMTDFPKCSMENFSWEGAAGDDLLTEAVLSKDEVTSSWGSIPPAACQGCTERGLWGGVPYYHIFPLLLN